jgi:2',3'-cyclic-nucleotide 2'-phosphodiesterase (5'-nucleotidase family)
VKAIEQVLPDVRSKSDFVIVTAHLTAEEEKGVAEAFPEIRLIVGGHVHSALGPIWIGETMVARTGNVGRFVGRVDLDFSARVMRRMEGKLIPVMDVAAAADISKIIEPYQKKVAARMNEVIGEASADLASANNAESSLANLIADAYREHGKTQIALHSVFEVLPFQNTLVTLKLTGAQLKKTLGWNLLGVSGVRVRLDLSKPPGQRLVSATLTDGSPLEDTASYTVTINDFVLAGGDGFSEVGKGAEIKDTGILLRDVFVTYIKAHVVLSPVLDGRVIVD